MCCVLLVACGNKAAPPEKPLVAPRVEAASVLAPDMPPYVLLLDDTGVRIARISKWPVTEPPAKPASLAAIARQIGTTVKPPPDPRDSDLPGPQSQMGPRGPLDTANGVGGDLDGRPSRVARVAGKVTKGRMVPVRAMVIAPPALAATKLIDVVAATEAAIAVSHDGKIRPLHLDFVHHDNVEVPWLEAHVSTSRIAIEAVPDTPIETSLDHIGDALAKARAARDLPAAAPVDVLVDADVNVQRLVDVLVALDTAGVPMIGMSGPPSEVEQALRGHRTPYLLFGQPTAQGDLDKALIRRAIKAHQVDMLRCFTTARATNATLAGTVIVQFFVTPSGNVAQATGSGVSPELATCMENVVKAIEFPPPKGGGGCQVSYPFTFRD